MHPLRVYLAIAIALAAVRPHEGRAHVPGLPLPPLPARELQKYVRDKLAWQRFLQHYAARRAAIEAFRPAAPAAPPPGNAWFALDNLLPGNARPSNPLLLTDGTVMVHVSLTGAWYRLTPDAFGSYQKGTWRAAATLPDGYFPRFFSSAILPDGRVLVEGGEYNGVDQNNQALQVWTSLGAIYDPIADTWTPVAPPDGWNSIGDGSGLLLANGTFLLGNALTAQTAQFDAGALTWTATGTHKFDANDEENWTLLPDGDVLTVDGYAGKSKCGTGSEQYIAGKGKWLSSGSTVHKLSGCSGNIRTGEAPTQILRPNGSVVAFGSTASTPLQNFPSHTAVYEAQTGGWVAGPDLPALDGVSYTLADAPVAILPSGNVLLAASPGISNTQPYDFPQPVHFWEFDGTSFTQVADIPDGPALASYEMNFLVLPTGHVLAVETDMAAMEIFADGSTYDPSWAPVITAPADTTLVPDGTYQIGGTQFSGLTSGAAYGNENASSTNYPLVQITNIASGHVFFARTFNFTSASVAPGAASSTSFTLPTDIDTGPSNLVVIANGIPSAPEAVTVVRPSLTIDPATCVHMPWTGGKQAWTVSVTNPPPGLSLQYGFQLNFGGAEASGVTVTDKGAVIIPGTSPKEYVGPSRRAVVTVASLQGSGFGLENALDGTLWYQTKDGLLHFINIPLVAGAFTVGADACTADSTAALPDQ